MSKAIPTYGAVIWEDLCKPMPEEAIQRTKKEETRKGYDTTGFGYQFVVNRFNNVLRDGWGFDWNIIKEQKGQFSNGRDFWDVTVSCSIWVATVESEAETTYPSRTCVGGHISSTFADALKGAITNAFKKTAAFWGVGREAYEGHMDDDNKPYPEGEKVKEIFQKTFPVNENRPLSGAQIKRLFAIAYSNEYGNEDVKNLMKEKFDIESTSELTRPQYDELCLELDNDK